MSAEKISIDDFMSAARDLAADRSAGMWAASAAFAKGRNEVQDRPLDPIAKAELSKRYLTERTAPWLGDDDSLKWQADLFVGAIECYANGLASICATLPPPQEERRTKVRQLAGALQRLQEVLTTIDSGALGQTLHEIDKELNDGKAKVATDQVEAFILAGAIRAASGELLSKVIVATTRAANVIDEPDYDPILEVIWQMEKEFEGHGLPFETKESGFAAECFRAMFEHANPGKTKDRPKYLLKKAVGHERSWASFKDQMRKKLP